MKLIALPEGMITTKKTHRGKRNYKYRSFDGFIRSVDTDRKIETMVDQNTEQQFVVITIVFNDMFICTNCCGYIEYVCGMVMN